MIQIKFREAGGRVSSIEELAKIANGLLAANYEETVLLYFEFANVQEMLLFCRAVSIIPLLRDMEELENRKRSLQKEVDGLAKEVEEQKKATYHVTQ